MCVKHQTQTVLDKSGTSRSVLCYGRDVAMTQAMLREREGESEIERLRTSSTQNDALGKWKMRGNEVLKFIDFKMSSRREMRMRERERRWGGMREREPIS